MDNQQSLGVAALFFGLLFLVQALSIGPSLWLISKKGLRFSVFWGSMFLVGFFMLLYLAKLDPIFLILAAVIGGVQIGLYWTAYHIYIAELTDDKRQGEEIAMGNSLSAVAAIGGPAFGGLIIQYFGFEAVFIIMALITLIANLPLRYLPSQKNIISVDILKTISTLSPKKEKKSYLALFGLGTIDVVAGNFWPLFIFPVMAGFVGLGFVGSLIALVSTVTTITIGVLIDKYGPKAVINILSPIDSLVWISRIFVNTPFRVFGVSGAQSLTTAGQIITVDSMIYERARHDNLVAFIIQREMGLALGKFIFLLVLGILFWFGLPLITVFIFAALAALLPKFYPAEESLIKAAPAINFKLAQILKIIFGKKTAEEQA